MSELEEVDAVVIGGTSRGLIAAYLLGTLGYRAVLIEKGAAIGGVDRSFLTPGGTRFDIGLHVLDEMRSEIATRLFRHVVDGEVHRIELARAIVLRNQILPYAPERSQMPEKIRSMLPVDDLVDDVGDSQPTRERLAAIYGRAYADLIYDEVLPSYRCENRHRDFGVDESLLLSNVYPWFFPRARRKSKSDDESRRFHDQLRSGTPQHILYPKQGGFGGFVDGFLRHLEAQRVEVITGARDLRLETEGDRHIAKWVDTGDRRIRARHYFWAGSWPDLCKNLDLPCQETATDRVLLGSFRLNRPAHSDFHEILVGDPSHLVNRIYFPARFRESDDPLMQIEYSIPTGEDWPLEADYWQKVWIESTTRLGILDAAHHVEEFDFKSFAMHFNSYGMEGVALRDADPSLIHSDSNIRPVAPSMANLNLNSHVPRDIQVVLSALSDPPPPEQL